MARPLGERPSRLTLRRGLASARLRAGLAVPVVVVGLGGGLIGAAYLASLRLLTGWLGPDQRSTLAQAAILVAVGVSITVLGRVLGESGNVELLVDNIHVLGGAEDVRQVRSLVPTSLLCIASGGAMGPEAPLVQTSGSFGTWIADRFRLDAGDMRVVTITGMAAGFSVLFGAPLGAALFALEILHKRGLQYYEALIPALVGALVGYALNLGLTGIGLDPIWHLPEAGPLTGSDLLWGALCGVIGAAGALAFTGGVSVGRWAVSRVPVGPAPGRGRGAARRPVLVVAVRADQRRDPGRSHRHRRPHRRARSRWPSPRRPRACSSRSPDAGRAGSSSPCSSSGSPAASCSTSSFRPRTPPC